MKTKSDDAGEAEYRDDQDKIECIVRETVIGLKDAIAIQGDFVVSYLRLLETDLKPVFDPLIKAGSIPNLQFSVAARNAVIANASQAQQEFTSSADSERALALVREIQRRTEARFAKQDSTARRMRLIATWAWFSSASAQ
jgi:hypothetical protein